MKTPNVTLICDLQFGSTGKGLIAGYLAERDAPDVVVTAWSPNAGHTYIDASERKFVHCMLANGVVSPNLKYVLIGPGSQIGIEKLFEEMEACRDLLFQHSAVVLIHEHACVVQPRHVAEEEVTMTGIGSTKKGCGAALIDKIRRQPSGPPIVARDFIEKIEDMAVMRGHHIRVITAREYDAVIDNADRIQVEGAQGYSLGINSGFYPYVTSRECTPAQIMTDCAIPMSRLQTTVGTMRTLPIRVANRYDENGEQIGYSGPGYSDQQELKWEAIGVEPELTTVTKLPRRIFTFSHEQAYRAIRACSPDEVFLNFCNYVPGDDANSIIDTVTDCGSFVRYLGWGPTKNDVSEVGL